MEKNQLKDIVVKVVEKIHMQEDRSFPVEMSARHVHLTPKAVKQLFGEGAEMIVKRNLTLPGFLAEQRVTIITEKGVFKNVAVLGPARDHIQVELSAADAYALGIKPPVNISGNLSEAADVYLVGPAGIIHAAGSAIIAQAHVHMNSDEAKEYDVEDREIVEVELLSSRPAVLKNVMIRVGEGMHAMMHIDMDEANACGYTKEMRGVIHKISRG